MQPESDRDYRTPTRTRRRQPAGKDGKRGKSRGAATFAAPSGPNSVPTASPPTTGFFRPSKLGVLTREDRFGRTGQCSTREHRGGMNIRLRAWTTNSRQMLLRKEVIQPHLPVRLPCYDFVPIADPTFDGSLHKGWATGFGCYRLS
jgi:hypothetical protein